MKKFVGQKETYFFVLRHGETKWNSINKLHGHLDSPLTKKGVCQALQQNKSLHLQDLSNFIVISSPQKRAYDTAVVALSGITDKINIDDDLVEIGIGDWSGKKLKNIEKGLNLNCTKYELTQLYNRAPNGEGIARLYQRCYNFIKKLNSPSVLVTHGITSRCLRLAALGWSLDRLDELPSEHGVVYRVLDGKHSIV